MTSLNTKATNQPQKSKKLQENTPQTPHQRPLIMVQISLPESLRTSFYQKGITRARFITASRLAILGYLRNLKRLSVPLGSGP